MFFRILLLFIAAAFLLFFQLGFFPFLDYDEATFALVLSESLKSGDFLSLTSRGQPWIDKPPLLFWLMAVSVKFFGENEFAMRLPSALFGLAAIYGVWLLTLQATGDYRKSFLAGAILLSIGDFVFAARQIRMDVPVTAAILFAAYFFIRGWGKGYWYLGFGVMFAASVLLKSVIGFFVFPVILIFSAVYGKREWLRSRYFWLGIILAALLVIPWYFYETMRFGGDFIRQLFAHNVASRFTRSTASFLYYPKLLFQFTQPWITVFLAMFWWIGRKFRFWLKNDKLAIASLFSVFLMFLAFETASTKLFYYLEPIYPFLAIFIASVSIDFFETIRSAARKRLFAATYLLLFLIGLVSVFWQILEIKGGQGGEYALAKEERDIGRYLSTQNVSSKVYTSNFYNYETIYYYGREKYFNLTPFQGELKEAPFFLIIPSSILQSYDLDQRIQEKSRLAYVGKILTMFEVR